VAGGAIAVRAGAPPAVRVGAPRNSLVKGRTSALPRKRRGPADETTIEADALSAA
jgi:hypothetical protein